MPSRGSLIPRRSAESDEHGDTVSTAQVQTKGSDPSVNATPGLGDQAEDHRQESFMPPVFDSSTLTFDEMRDAFMPWDSFDMQVNDYYDPGRGIFGFQY